MARRPSNKLERSTLLRLIQLAAYSDFRQAYEYLLESYTRFGSDPDSWRMTENAGGRRTYSGFYYDLRELCDDYSLPFEPAERFLLKMLELTRENMSQQDPPPNPTDVLDLMRVVYEADQNLSAFTNWFDSCPPQRHWDFFRMARSGAGCPTPQEIQTAEDRLGQHTPGGKRKRDFAKGFSEEALADMYHVSDRTVRNAIDDCWNYLRHSLNPMQIVKHLHLEPEKILELTRIAKRRPDREIRAYRAAKKRKN